MGYEVILVDKQGRQIGTESCQTAHTEGALHRSFGVFIVNNQNQMLLQKRSSKKSHSAGLWSNTCSSHPKPGEKTIEAAHRRLKEEMGFDCELQEAFTFIYEANFQKIHIKEHEFGHVFIGFSDEVPRPNHHEVDAYRWMSIEKLTKDVTDNPHNYTHWCRTSLDGVILFIKRLQREDPLIMQPNATNTKPLPL